VIGIYVVSVVKSIHTIHAALPKWKSQYDTCRNFKIHGRNVLRTLYTVLSLFGSVWMGAMTWHY